MYICYLRDGNEIDVERCRISLRDKSPIAFSTSDGAGRVAYFAGFVQSLEFDPNRAIGLRWRVEMDVLTVASLSSIPPEVLESMRRQSGVDDGAGDRRMAEPAPNSPGIVPLVGESVAAGVPGHVRVGFQLETGTGGGALDHPREARRKER
jgi:hypothetical protein